jgi:drug/metabolite transporter (DMT)-like permease
MPQKYIIGYGYALLAVIIWSGNFVIASGFVDDLPPITLAALRWLAAAVAFLPFVYRQILKEKEAILAWKWPMLAASLTGITLFNTLVYVSARTTDTLNMALFASATPIFVVILSRLFLRERISPLRAVGLAIAVLGMLTIATRGDLDVLLHMTFRVGDLWMLLAGLLWAVYSILVKKKPLNVSPLSFLGTTFALGLIPLIPAAILEQQYCAPWSFTPGIVGAILYVSLGASLAAFFLWNSAVTAIGPATSSLFQYFLPVFSGIAAYFLLGQPITVPHAVGFVLILTGVVLATRTR